MAMSKEHKQALAQGRKEAAAIKAYLRAIETKRPGRPVTKKSLTTRLEAVSEKIAESDNPLKRVDLVQTKLDIEKTLSELAEDADTTLLEAGFVEHAAPYSDRKGISYTAWRQVGVPAAILRRAGIAETRRR